MSKIPCVILNQNRLPHVLSTQSATPGVGGDHDITLDDVWRGGTVGVEEFHPAVLLTAALVESFRFDPVLDRHLALKVHPVLAGNAKAGPECEAGQVFARAVAAELWRILRVADVARQVQHFRGDFDHGPCAEENNTIRCEIPTQQIYNDISHEFKKKNENCKQTTSGTK